MATSLRKLTDLAIETRSSLEGEIPIDSEYVLWRLSSGKSQALLAWPIRHTAFSVHAWSLRIFPPELRVVIFDKCLDAFATSRRRKGMSHWHKTPPFLIALRGDLMLYYEAAHRMYRNFGFNLRANLIAQKLEPPRLFLYDGKVTRINLPPGLPDLHISHIKAIRDWRMSLVLLDRKKHHDHRPETASSSLHPYMIVPNWKSPQTGVEDQFYEALFENVTSLHLFYGPDDLPQTRFTATSWMTFERESSFGRRMFESLVRLKITVHEPRRPYEYGRFRIPPLDFHIEDINRAFGRSAVLHQVSTGRADDTYCWHREH